MTATQFVPMTPGAALADYSSPLVINQVLDEPRWSGVARYPRPLSPKSAKWLTPTERDWLHRSDIAIVLVYESFQTRPLAGYGAGMADAAQAELFGMEIDYPQGMAFPVAVDIDAVRQVYPLTPGNLAAIGGYLDGYAFRLATTNYYEPGVYGDYEAIELFKDRSKLNWQMGARSFSHSLIHPAAHLVQYPEAWKGTGLAFLGDEYAGPHSTPGVDSNVCLRSFDAWLPTTINDVPPARPPAGYNPDKETDMPTDHVQMIRDARYTVVLLVGAGTPEWLTAERVAALNADGVPGPLVCAAHPSFDVLAARAGIGNLGDYPA